MAADIAVCGVAVAPGSGPGACLRSPGPRSRRVPSRATGAEAAGLALAEAAAAVALGLAHEQPGFRDDTLDKQTRAGLAKV